MNIHDVEAVRRNITFSSDVTVVRHSKASEPCCWDCNYSKMMYESLWCDREMGEVHYRDLCQGWERESPAAEV